MPATPSSGRIRPAVILVAALGLVAGSGLLAAPPSLAAPTAASVPNCLTFSAVTAGTYTCEVPAGVTSLAYVVQGAAGADSPLGGLDRGGRGALIKGTLAVSPGETLYLVVGRNGATGSLSGGGGGYSAIARGGFSKDDTPLVIAGGGGGGSSGSTNAPGGSANPALSTSTGGGAAGNTATTSSTAVGQPGGTGTTGGAGGFALANNPQVYAPGGRGGDNGQRGTTPASPSFQYRGGSGGNGWGYATETQRGGAAGYQGGGGGGSGYAGGGGGTGRNDIGFNPFGGGGGGSSLVPASGVTSKSIAPTTFGRVTLGTAPEVTAISPNAGPVAGGTSVTITGTSFISGATVTIGGTACTQVAVVSSTQITCTTPAKAGGTYDVVVTNPTGFAGTLAGGYSYFTCSPTTYVEAPYTYVAFDDTGTCTWAAPVGVTSADYVVVAGGGGGGSGIGGGGGGGDMRDDTIAIRDDSTSRLLTITVGAGGAGSSSAAAGTSGGPSALGSGDDSVTAVGGGGGGSNDGNGLAGGSGGGAGGSLTAGGVSRIGGAGLTGGAGGNSDDTTACGTAGYCPGGGGGGAGGTGGIGGGVGDDTTAGAGGVGRSVAWLDDTVSRNLQIGDDSGGVPVFAGGGGGGVDDSTTAGCAGACGVPGIGGAGGGGTGSKIAGATAASGISTTGGGGGGASTTGTGGSGGSGVVVLRIESTVLPDCVADSAGTNGAFTVLTFASAGQCAFTRPPGVSAISYLLIGGGGGGGGGSTNGGGGGGGGSIRDDSVQRPLGDDTVLIFSIGAGGLAGQTAGAAGRDGLPSSIEIGATTYTAPGGQGGTGGGTTPAAGGPGGTGGDSTSAGGGGGAGALSSDDSAGSVGSDGPTSDASGSPLNYGGGGGGGAHPLGLAAPGSAAGGAGGGGAGANGTTATANPGLPGENGLGGGGGGGQGGGPTGGAGGNGGSGGLILEYLTPTQVSLSVAGGSGDDTYGFAFSPQPQISIDDSSGNRVVDDSGTVVTATILDGIGNVMQEDTAIAQSGLATFDGLGFDDSVLAGTPTITFTAVGLTSTDETVIVNQYPPQPAAWTAMTVARATSEGLTPPDVSGVYSYASGGLPGTWTYSSADPEIASVSGSSVTGVALGTTTIFGVFTPADGRNYLTATAELTVTVTPGIVYPPSAPREVVAVAGDGQATVSWQVPLDSGSFPVTTYEVVSQPDGKTCVVAAPALTCTITGLTNGVAYTFEVRALNGAGWGPWSEPSDPVTPQREITVPGPVRDIRVMKVTAGGTVVVRWRVPAFDGGSPVFAYRVGTREVGTPRYVRVRPDATSTRIRIRGLEPGRSYWVRIRAENIVGYGPGARYDGRVVIPPG